MSTEIIHDGKHRIVTASHEFEHGGRQVCRASVAITRPERGDQFYIEMAEQLAAMRAEKFRAWMKNPPAGMARKDIPAALGVRPAGRP